jgi:hypothetical protein
MMNPHAVVTNAPGVNWKGDGNMANGRPDPAHQGVAITVVDSVESNPDVFPKSGGAGTDKFAELNATGKRAHA